MPKLQEKFKRMPAILEILAITEEEEKALHSYQGHSGSTEINELLADFITDTPAPRVEKENTGDVLGKKEYYSYYENKRENPEQYIAGIMQKIQNLYASMVKNSYLQGDFGPRVYRGSGHSLLEQDVLGFLSTSESINEACLWAVSNNRKALRHVVSDIRLDADVPYIVMPAMANEEEILISPFVELEDGNQEKYYASSGEFSGTPIRREYLIVHNKKPQQIDRDEMKKLESELLEGASNFSHETDKCFDLKTKMRETQDQMQIKRDSYNRISRQRQEYISDKDWKEDLAYIDIALQKLEQEYQNQKNEYVSTAQSISAYKKKFRALMEGKCAAIEQEIDQKINAIIGPVVEAERREQSMAEQKIQQGMTNARNIAQLYEQSMRGAEDVISQFVRKQAIMEQSGINFDSPLTHVLNVARDVDWAVKGLSYVDENSVGLLKNANVLSSLSDDEKQQILESTDNEYKRAIAQKILKIRSAQEIRILQGELAEKASEKVGFFGKISGKQQAHEKEVAILQGKLDSASEFHKRLLHSGLIEDRDDSKLYSARDLMAEIHIARESGMTRDEQEDLEKLERALTTAYHISDVGIKKKYENKKQQSAVIGRAETFYGNYSRMISRNGIIARTPTDAEKNLVRDSQVIIRSCREQNNYLIELENKRNNKQTSYNLQR
ncbi:MAG: hypothetical protein IJ215_00225 [Clostridia bacterium]|nr:hypothetical protein [Clostridia bacterium]